MPQTKNVCYDDSGNYVFDPLKVEFTGTEAQLALEDNPSQLFNQDFSSDTGFTYDSSVTEFTGGQIQQIDLKPANSTFYASYESIIDGDWGDGVLTASTVGGPVINSGELDLDGGSKYVDYPALGNADHAQQLTIRFLYRPNYSGTPSSIRYMFSISRGISDTANELYLFHSSGNGNLVVRARDSVGATIYSTAISNFSPTLGQQYEFEVNFDFDAGETRVFIDGVQSGATISGSGSRSSDIGLFRIGANIAGSQITNAKFKDLIVFDSVQHTSDYTPGASIPLTFYQEDIITFPDFIYSGLGSIQQFISFASTLSSNIRFSLNDYYWNGSAWVVGTNIYSEMSDVSDISSEILTFPVSNTITIRARTTSQNNIPEFISNLDLGYTGQVFPIDNPSIKEIGTVTTNELVSFSATTNEPAGSEIRYVISVSGQDKYWDGLAWSDSDGTFLQTSTVQEINDNAASLDLDGGFDVTPTPYLNSDGVANPSITCIDFQYNFYVEPAQPDICMVFGYTTNLSGVVIPNAEICFTPSLVYPKANSSVYKVILSDVCVISDADGWFKIPLIETETTMQTVDCRIKYINSKGKPIEIIQKNLTIPNKTTESFNTIVASSC